MRGIDLELHGIGDFYLNFIDDFIISSKDIDEHMIHLETLLNRVQQKGITINFKKMQLFREEVKFLGHILTNQGIQPDPEKLIEITEFPVPQKVKQLCGFLGLVDFAQNSRIKMPRL